MGEEPDRIFAHVASSGDELIVDDGLLLPRRGPAASCDARK